VSVTGYCQSSYAHAAKAHVQVIALKRHGRNNAVTRAFARRDFVRMSGTRENSAARLCKMTPDTAQKDCDYNSMMKIGYARVTGGQGWIRRLRLWKMAAFWLWH
jgi:hypothetical protein